MSGNHDREFSRSRIAVAAEIVPEDGESIRVQVKDLSLHGIMVHAHDALTVGQKCRIRVLFGRVSHELPVIADGVVVRRQGDYFAIRFDVIGFESNEELESMILTHSDNPEEVLKEFALDEIPFDPLSARDFDPDEPH